MSARYARKQLTRVQMQKSRETITRFIRTIAATYVEKLYQPRADTAWQEKRNKTRKSDREEQP
ncbi:unnamed protein product [Leuciscus chuanchicus]